MIVHRFGGLRRLAFCSLLGIGMPLGTPLAARELAFDEGQLYYELGYDAALFFGAPHLIKTLKKGSGEGRKRLPYQPLDDEMRRWLRQEAYHGHQTPFETRINEGSGTINRGIRLATLLAVPFRVPAGHRLGAYMATLHAVETWYFSSQFLRTVIARYRPRTYYAANPDYSTLKMDSHPSGHAGEAFVWAHIASRVLDLGTGWQIGAYGLATASSLARVRGGHHFVSDIIAGAGLGIGIAHLTFRFLHSTPDAPASDASENKESAWRFDVGARSAELTYTF